MRPKNKHKEVLIAMYVQHGGMSRFSGHSTPFLEEPEDLKGGSYFLFAQMQFAELFNLTPGDSNTVITGKMSGKHNEFFGNLTDEEGELYSRAKSQQQLNTLTDGKAQMIPFLGMVRVNVSRWLGNSCTTFVT